MPKARSGEGGVWLGHGGARGGPELRGSDEARQTPHRELERGPGVEIVSVDNSRSDVKNSMLNSVVRAGEPAGKDPVAVKCKSTRIEEPTDAPPCKPAQRYSPAPNSLSSIASVHSISSSTPSSSAGSNAAGQLLSREILAAKFDPTPSAQQQCCAQDQSRVLVQRPTLNPTNGGFVSMTQAASQLAGPPLGTQGPGAAAHGSHG